jgi:hypothetical protein
VDPVADPAARAVPAAAAKGDIMRSILTYFVSGAILAVLSPLAAAQSAEGTMLSDQRFWQGPDARKIEQRVERRSQQALDSLERQRHPHGDPFGRVEGGSRNSTG